MGVQHRQREEEDEDARDSERKTQHTTTDTTVGKLAFTSDSTNIQTVSHWTFTAERAICVDALAINARVIEAFINICNYKNINIKKLT